MIVILVIPFLEFSLPFLLRLFPNMLPSTYEDKLKKEEELKRRLSVKLELASFLQDTVAEVAKDISRRKGPDSAAELMEFIRKVRSGQPVGNEDILRFAKLFNDELTLENLERVQLVSICQFLSIAPFGTDAFLRSRLRSELQRIKHDDYQIEEEGLETLTDEELRAACRARGMRAPLGKDAVAYMRRQLQDWLDLSLHRGLPSSLLLLSRAFTITATVRDVAQNRNLPTEKLQGTLSVIVPGEAAAAGIAAGTQAAIAAAAGSKEAGSVENSIAVLQKKLDRVKREEALIKDELRRAALARAKKGLQPLGPSAMAAAGGASEVLMASDQAGLVEASIAAPPAAGPAAVASPAAAAAAAAEPSAANLSATVAAADPSTQEEHNAEQRQQRLHTALQALMDLALHSGVAKERGLFMKLIKKDTERINKELAMSSGSDTASMLSGSLFPPAGSAGGLRSMSSSPKRLNDRVSKLLTGIEKELDKVEHSIGGKLHVVDTDNDGFISQQELQGGVAFLKQQLSASELQELYRSLGGSGSIEVANLLQLAAGGAKPEAQLQAAPETVKIHVR